MFLTKYILYLLFRFVVVLLSWFVKRSHPMYRPVDWYLSFPFFWRSNFLGIYWVIGLYYTPVTNEGPNPFGHIYCKNELTLLNYSLLFFKELTLFTFYKWLLSCITHYSKLTIVKPFTIYVYVYYIYYPYNIRTYKHLHLFNHL